MDKKEELKKLIEGQNEENDFFTFSMTKQLALFGTIFSPTFILLILSEWIFKFMDYSDRTPELILRPFFLIIGVSVFIISFRTYRNKIKNEKEKKNGLIN